MRPIITVIVPVFKVELYLEECLDSILNQSFKDFELILVDDGSPDHCPEICDFYADKDERIIVIHKKNGGLSSARNAGIEAARGSYFCFIDSDDYISPFYLEHLYNALVDNNSDMAVCQMEIEDGYCISDVEQNGHIDLLTKIEAFECLVDYRNQDMVVAWNKLYCRQLFKDIRYPVGRIHEDEAIIHLLINECNSVSWLNEKLYYYRKTEGSITRSKYTLKCLDEILAKEERLNFFKTHGYEKLYRKYAITFCSILMRHYRIAMHEIDDTHNREKILNMLHGKFLDTYAVIANLLDIKKKTRFYLFRMMPGFIARIEYRRYERNLK